MEKQQQSIDYNYWCFTLLVTKLILAKSNSKKQKIVVVQLQMFSFLLLIWTTFNYYSMNAFELFPFLFSSNLSIWYCPTLCACYTLCHLHSFASHTFRCIFRHFSIALYPFLSILLSLCQTIVHLILLILILSSTCIHSLYIYIMAVSILSVSNFFCCFSFARWINNKHLCIKWIMGHTNC